MSVAARREALATLGSRPEGAAWRVDVDAVPVTPVLKDADKAAAELVMGRLVALASYPDADLPARSSRRHSP